MASPQQIEANRQNARKSTGPRTEGGKGRSKLNAVRHGLRAETIEVLPHEDPDAFHRRVDAWLRDFAPRNAAEVHLIHRAALLSWKLDRADQHELSTLSRRVIEAVDALDEEEQDHVVLETARIASFDATAEGERIRRYQFALSRELIRALRALPQSSSKTSKPAPITSRTVIPRAKVEVSQPSEPKPPVLREPTQAPNEPNLGGEDRTPLNSDGVVAPSTDQITITAGPTHNSAGHPTIAASGLMSAVRQDAANHTNEPKFGTKTLTPKAPNEPKSRSDRKRHRAPISRQGARFREPEPRTKSTFEVALIKGRPCFLSEISLLGPDHDRG